jgi:hypothetical protein
VASRSSGRSAVRRRTTIGFAKLLENELGGFVPPAGYD